MGGKGVGELDSDLVFVSGGRAGGLRTTPQIPPGFKAGRGKKGGPPAPPGRVGDPPPDLISFRGAPPGGGRVWGGPVGKVRAVILASIESRIDAVCRLLKFSVAKPSPLEACGSCQKGVAASHGRTRTRLSHPRSCHQPGPRRLLGGMRHGRCVREARRRSGHGPGEVPLGALSLRCAGRQIRAMTERANTS